MARKSANKRNRGPATQPAPGQRPSLQVGALCWRRTSGGLIKVVLITSRDTGRWVIPKGWPMRNRTDPQAAAREAYEEAGVKGEVADRSIGLFAYDKGLGKAGFMTCTVKVYPLEVRELLRRFPENGQRDVKWFTRDKAADRVGEPDLATLIRGFDPPQAAAK